jgi:hypothetical protein
MQGELMEEWEDHLDFTPAEAVDALQDILEWLYFDFMLCVKGSKYKDFRSEHVKMMRSMCDAIHDRYCDHVEAEKKEKLARLGLNGERL